MSINPLKYRPTKLNEAQRLLIALGVDDLVVTATAREPNKSFTKKGPGRVHARPDKPSAATTEDAAGVTAAAASVVRNAGLFLGQRTNPTKNAKRKAKRIHGARHLKRMSTQSVLNANF